MSKDTGAQFNQVELEYDFISELFHDQRFFLDNLSNERQLALEIGCGSGRLTKALADEYEYIIGIDISESLLAIARANQSKRNVLYLCMDANHIGLNAQFDFIISQNTFHHIEDLETLLPSIKQLLKPDGKLIIQDVISETPTPATWVYVVGAFQELPVNIFKYGLSIAWRVFRFRLSEDWLKHLSNDVYLSSREFKALYGRYLPDCVFPDEQTVIWQNKLRGQ